MCVQSPAAFVSAVCAPWHFCFLNSCHVVIHSSFCFHQALVVHFEADTERRKLGLPHRVNFLGRSSLEPEYTQTEEVELRLQRTPVCTTVVFQLHVSYTYVYTEPDQKLQPELLIAWTQRVVNNLWLKWMERSCLIHFTALTCLLFCQNTIIFAPCINFLTKSLHFPPLFLQEGIQDKLRPISLAITHTIKSVPPRRHSGAKRLEKLAPVLNVSPSNTLHYEVWRNKKKKRKKKRILSPGLMLMG